MYRILGKTEFLISLSFIGIFAFALSTVHLRVQTTIIGYTLGSLKQKESELLERQSHLRMNLARLTTRNHLQLMAQRPISRSLGSYVKQD